LSIGFGGDLQHNDAMISCLITFPFRFTIKKPPFALAREQKKRILWEFT
jgi:hypothetical protein